MSIKMRIEYSHNLNNEFCTTFPEEYEMQVTSEQSWRVYWPKHKKYLKKLVCISQCALLCKLQNTSDISNMFSAFLSQM